MPLDDDRMPTLIERYKVPHFDTKGESDRFFTEQGVPTTLLRTTFYWDNLIYFGMEPQRGEDGNLVFSLPMGDKKLPGIAAEDIGKCAFGLFEGGDDFIGKAVGIAGEHLNGVEMAAELTEALGETVNYFAVPFDMYRSFDFPGAADLGNMFQVMHDFNEDYTGGPQHRVLTLRESRFAGLPRMAGKERRARPQTLRCRFVERIGMDSASLAPSRQSRVRRFGSTPSDSVLGFGSTPAPGAL